MNAHTSAIYAFDALSRERALRPNETDMLCALIGEKRRLWTQADDRELSRMKRRGMNATEIGRETGRSAMAVRIRLHHLKRKGASSAGA